MTKKKLLGVDTLGIFIFSTALIISIKGICLADFICNRPHDDSLSLILFPIIPLFIFSLITYPMKENVFQSWWRFARTWVPLSMLAILVSPSNSHNWMLPIEKGIVAFFSSIIFVSVSIVLIIIWQIKEKKSLK